MRVRGGEGEGGEVEVEGEKMICPKIKSHSCLCNFLFFNI